MRRERRQTRETEEVGKKRGEKDKGDRRRENTRVAHSASLLFSTSAVVVPIVFLSLFLFSPSLDFLYFFLGFFFHVSVCTLSRVSWSSASLSRSVSRVLHLSSFLCSLSLLLPSLPFFFPSLSPFFVSSLFASSLGLLFLPPFFTSLPLPFFPLSLSFLFSSYPFLLFLLSCFLFFFFLAFSLLLLRSATRVSPTFLSSPPP